jgi:hypothetical protein
LGLSEGACCRIVRCAQPESAAGLEIVATMGPDVLGDSTMRRLTLVVVALVGLLGLSTGAFAANVTYVLDTPGVV